MDFHDPALQGLWAGVYPCGEKCFPPSPSKGTLCPFSSHSLQLETPAELSKAVDALGPILDQLN